MTQEKTVEPTTGSVEASVRGTWRSLVEWLANRNSMVIIGAGFALGFWADRAGLESIDWVFYLAGGLLPILLMTVSTEADGFDYEMGPGERVRFVLSMLRLSVLPWGFFVQALQIAGNVVPYVRYRGALPGRERHVPDTELTAPFDGEWTTVNGGVTKTTSHSWGLVSQRYAYDFVRTDESGSTHEGDGNSLEDYYAFGEPIRAPADGTVVATEDSLRDYPHPGTGWTEWRTWRIVGNYVVIEHDDGEYSLLAHLEQGSVAVEPGETVARGDVVGACGNSGNSSEPHLHFQVMDHRNFWIAAGLVPRFSHVALSRPDDRRETHEFYGPLNNDGTDDERPYLWAGDRIRPANTAHRTATQATPTDS